MNVTSPGSGATELVGRVVSHTLFFLIAECLQLDGQFGRDCAQEYMETECDRRGYTVQKQITPLTEAVLKNHQFVCGASTTKICHLGLRPNHD